MTYPHFPYPTPRQQITISSVQNGWIVESPLPENKDEDDDEPDYVDELPRHMRRRYRHRPAPPTTRETVWRKRDHDAMVEFVSKGSMEMDKRLRDREV